MNDDIIVSIVCNVYNQEDYIRQTIDSFLSQITDFNIEILIHDDVSTDNTRIILKEYELKYPELIKVIYQTENQYRLGRSSWVDYQFPRALGKFIALCDGDDYWTDPYKLQKQVDFLDKNLNFVLYCHNTTMLDENDSFIKEGFIINDNTILKTKNLLGDNYFNIIPTASVVFRNILKKNNFEFISISPFGDFPLYIELSKYGDIYFDKNVYSVYRRNGKGTTSSLTKLQQLNDLIEFYILVKVFHPDYTLIAVEKLNYIHNLIEDINFNKINHSLDYQKKELAEFYVSESTLLNNISFLKLCKLIFKKIIRFITQKKK